MLLHLHLFLPLDIFFTVLSTFQNKNPEKDIMSTSLIPLRRTADFHFKAHIIDVYSCEMLKCIKMNQPHPALNRHVIHV